MPSFFQKLKTGLSKSSSNLIRNISGVLTSKRLDSQTLEDLEDILLMSDMGASTSASLISDLSKEKFGKETTEKEIRLFLSSKIEDILKPIAIPLVIDRAHKPFVILMIGVNGSGKTTSIGKMAKQFKDKGLKVSIVAGDTFRAAAIEQLKVWGERTDIPVIAKETGSDAAGLIFDAYKQSIKNNDDVLLIDTAGRLQNKSGLMAELEKIIRVLRKIDSSAPHSTILSLDATVGQNAHSQLQTFNDIMGVTGIIMTKLDGTAKGGVIVSLADKFKIPVHYIGVGEGIDDLEPFNSKDFANILMGVEEN